MPKRRSQSRPTTSAVDLVLTIQEAAVYHECSVDTIRNAIERGEIHARKSMGGSRAAWILDRDSVVTWRGVKETGKRAALAES